MTRDPRLVSLVSKAISLADGPDDAAKKALAVYDAWIESRGEEIRPKDPPGCSQGLCGCSRRHKGKTPK